MVTKLNLVVATLSALFFLGRPSPVQATTTHTNGRALIIYFSWGGATKRAAKAIQKQTRADLVALKPQKAYPTDYDGLVKVANKQRLQKVKPAIKTLGKDLDDYQVIYIGFPTWWHQPPMIIHSLFANYNFKQKTIVPFTTSMSDPMSKSMPLLKKLANKDHAKLLNGFRYDNNDKELVVYLHKNNLVKD